MSIAAHEALNKRLYHLVNKASFCFEKVGKNDPKSATLIQQHMKKQVRHSTAPIFIPTFFSALGWPCDKSVVLGRAILCF